MKYLDRKTGQIKEVSIETWETMHGNPPLPDYMKNRLKEYPSAGDQLDMIYWDKINNTNLWMEKITEIKTRYPKPPLK